MDKLVFMPNKFSDKELELIELLKKKEMTRAEIEEMKKKQRVTAQDVMFLEDMLTEISEK